MRQVAERADKDDDDDRPPYLVSCSRWFPTIVCRGFVDNAVGTPAIHPNVLSRPIPITTIQNRNHRTTANVDKSKCRFVLPRCLFILFCFVLSSIQPSGREVLFHGGFLDVCAAEFCGRGMTSKRSRIACVAVRIVSVLLMKKNILNSVSKTETTDRSVPRACLLSTKITAVELIARSIIF